MSGAIDRIGERFGDYQLLRLLGTGGFGQVYLGKHIHDRTPAAVKILQTRLTRSEELKEFLNEARTFRLNHPSIVRLLDFGIGAKDVPYLAMDYAPYGTLRDRHPKGTRVPFQTALSYVIPIASALQYAHEHHLVHRDIKPENMLIGPQYQIWLSDFGIVATAHSSNSMQTERVVGTWPYMAPEQIKGKPQTASDQYALGIVVYEWLSGKKPFTGTMTEIAVQHMQASPASLRTHIPTLSAAIDDVVLTALEKEPRNRFATIQDFANAFQRACQFPTRSSTVLQPFRPPKQPVMPQQLEELSVAKQKNTPFISRRRFVAGVAGLVVVGAASSYLWYTQTNTALQPRSTITSYGTSSGSPVSKPTPTPTPTSSPIGTPVFTYRRHTTYVYSVQWSLNDKRIVSSGEDKTVQIWNAMDGGNFFIYTGHMDRVNAASWSPDNQYIASGSSDKTVRVWRATDGYLIYTYKGHQSAIFTVAWSPGDQRIASGGQDTQVQVWNATTGLIYTYKGHQDIVNKLAWSPDGKRIASVSNDSTVQVWDAADGGNAFMYMGHKSGVRMAAWSPNGKRIASVGDDMTVQVWDAADGGNAFTYTGHKASVSAAAWSPDGKRIASSGNDKTVQVWDAVDGGNAFTYTGHNGIVFCVSWSHNGKYIASSGDNQDPTVRIWYA